MKERLFSGIQPTGCIHIGNYLGAIKNWIRLMEEYESIFCIVDYHAQTINYNPLDLKEKVIKAAIDNIACGLDPAKCTIFVQSMVPEHTELAWILGCCTKVGDLFRMTQYKQKSRQNETNVNSGLLTYPILQTADIVLYHATVVPVGEDQLQHLELAREIVRNFNSKFKEYFKEPRALVTKAKRVMGIYGKAKMSKSLNNTIALSENPESIWEKLRTAPTDPKRIRRKDKGTPENCNLYSYHTFFSDKETQKWVEHGCSTAEIGCIDCKKKLFSKMEGILSPIREKREQLLTKKNEIVEILVESSKKVRNIAKTTIAEVKEITGLAKTVFE